MCLENPFQLIQEEVGIFDINGHSPIFAEIVFEVQEPTLTGSRFPLQAVQNSDVRINTFSQLQIQFQSIFLFIALGK